MSLGTHPYTVGRFMLVDDQRRLLAALFSNARARLAERIGTTDWGRLFAMTRWRFRNLSDNLCGDRSTIIFRTAAFAALLLDALVRIWFDGDRRWWSVYSGRAYPADCSRWQRNTCGCVLGGGYT